MGAAKIRDKGKFGIGGNVQQGRESRGMTRQDVAEKMGISVAGLAAIEDNARKPTERELEVLQFALNFPRGFFFREDSPPGRFEPIFCGPDIVACDRCEYVADYLCDFPVGGGKTCDLPLCDAHAITQDGLRDIHFCPQHSTIARGLVSVENER